MPSSPCTPVIAGHAPHHPRPHRQDVAPGPVRRVRHAVDPAPVRPLRSQDGILSRRGGRRPAAWGGRSWPAAPGRGGDHSASSAWPSSGPGSSSTPIWRSSPARSPPPSTPISVHSGHSRWSRDSACSCPSSKRPPGCCRCRTGPRPAAGRAADGRVAGGRAGGAGRRHGAVAGPRLRRTPSGVVAIGVLCLISAGQFVVRGALVGLDRMDRYALVMVLDTLLRVAFAGAVALLIDDPGSSTFAWTLVAAVGLSHAPQALPARTRRVRLGMVPAMGSTPSPSGEVRRAVAPLLLGSLCAQLLLNGPPVLDPGRSRRTRPRSPGPGSSSRRSLLARVPLFLVVPLQTALLPILTALLHSGRPGGAAPRHAAHRGRDRRPRRRGARARVLRRPPAGRA